uniref:Beta-glucuronidase n=1 Tax=Strongyloides venezuelensis TaxID=75913 RepID=A0A0K0FCB3_STRVS
MLFPQKNEIRTYDLLDGLWTFVMEKRNSIGYGFINKWHKLKLSTFKNSSVMPVPSAYNDLGTDVELRDHVGWVWYQREYFVTKGDCNKRFLLRFGSVNYNAVVFLNDKQVMSHTGGHLPFESEVFFSCYKKNIITVAVNNTLSHDTIPPAEFKYKSGIGYPEGFFITNPVFDFFNYAGILRSVYVVKLNEYFVKSLSINSDKNGLIKYKIKVSKEDKKQSNKYSEIIREKHSYIYRVTIIDENDKVVFSSNSNSNGEIKIKKPKLWWPRGYGDPTLYKFVVEIVSKRKNIVYDKYIETFGFRSVELTKNNILINGREFYCLGFGMHEDSDIRGRGFDPVVMTKDLNLIEWMNGNCFRTSHYPYSEETSYEADRRGIAVITEASAVGVRYFDKPYLIDLHKKIIQEMITRDRNHPSTIAWSLANEPITERNINISIKYFKEMYKTAKQLDPSRPVTVVYNASTFVDETAKCLDFICFNMYFGWYVNMGNMDIVKISLINEVKKWKKRYKDVPLMLTEYGADSLSGLESLPSVSFTTNYQNDVIIANHKALDVLRSSKLIAGEMIWALADFMTPSSVIRAYGNHKGVFTRQRQPKIAAFTLRDRYKKLSKLKN